MDLDLDFHFISSRFLVESLSIGHKLKCELIKSATLVSILYRSKSRVSNYLFLIVVVVVAVVNYILTNSNQELFKVLLT